MAYLIPPQTGKEGGTRKRDLSETPPSVCGMPQGVILFPVLFNIYICTLLLLAQSFRLEHHQYADDTFISVDGSSVVEREGDAGLGCQSPTFDSIPMTIGLTVMSLGVTSDPSLFTEAQVSHFTRVTFLQLHQAQQLAS